MSHDTGQEKSNFWQAIGGEEEYAKDKRLQDASDVMPARLFQCSNASGSFKGTILFHISIRIKLLIYVYDKKC